MHVTIKHAHGKQPKSMHVTWNMHTATCTWRVKADACFYLNCACNINITSTSFRIILYSGLSTCDVKNGKPLHSAQQKNKYGSTAKQHFHLRCRLTKSKIWGLITPSTILWWTKTHFMQHCPQYYESYVDAASDASRMRTHLDVYRALQGLERTAKA